MKNKNLFTRIIIFILSNTLKPYLENYYLKKKRVFKYYGLEIDVHVNVFHPGLFFSSKFFSNFLNKLELENKSVLEIGCGTGFLSLVCEKKGAIVTAVDINESAVENAMMNAKKNNLKLNVIYSNLFDNIKDKFEYIILNPPYFPREPNDAKEYAWYCGENFEFFDKFFKQIKNHIFKDSKIYMVLADNCEIDIIKKIAKERGFNMEVVVKKFILIEENYLFNIKFHNSSTT